MKRLTALLDGEDDLPTFIFLLLALTRLCIGHARSEKSFEGAVACESESGGHGPGLMDHQWRCEDAEMHIIAMPIILAVNRAVVLSTTGRS
jgi:hypothetical protein